MRVTAVSIALPVLMLPAIAVSQARLPAEGGTTVSLGQPGPWGWSVGGALGFRSEAGLVSGVNEGRLGVHHEILGRALGLGGVQGEVYNQSFNAKYSAGVRARWVSHLTGVGVGADYSVNKGRVRPIFTYVHPVWRGGLFGDGSMLRLDVVTGDNYFFTFGVEKPILRRIPMGTTRPNADKVRLPSARLRPAMPLPASPAIRAALATARDAAGNMQRLCVPWVDHKGSGNAASDAAVVARLHELRQLTSVNGARRNINDETRRFHDAVDLAFATAVSSDNATAAPHVDAGRMLGNHARATLLAEVLFPYNRLLGQAKEKDSTHGYDVLARGAFLRWLHVDSRLPAGSHAAVLAVFDAMLEMVEDSRSAANREWNSSRFVWLPLQFGLRAEQHDTQAELDAIVEQAIAGRFTEGNSVSYVINNEFQSQLSRTVRAARSYHVLWTHDFRGYDALGNPDMMSYRHVLRSYLAALTARVRAYDSTGTFPTYIILLDEWFYQVNDGRLWMDLLEDPTRHRVRLGSRFVAMEDSLRWAQDSLRAAIAGSALLTSQRRQFGEAWLRNLVKVHVNITNASDPSFWSWHVVSGFPLPDTWMRDHRKIVFYDVSEQDPLRGEAILTGAGIGEHYANVSWEDRSMLVRGPVLLPLKAAARNALLKQGFAAANIPAVLQPLAPSDDQSRLPRDADAGDRLLRALQLQNGTGHDAKQINVAKAVLYTLMPAGSVVKIPDSLWNGTFWGSALIGAALRGVRVMVMAPSLDNAPARAFGSMVRSRELLWRLLMTSRILASPIAAAGGLLKVGMYTTTLPVTDVTGRLLAINTTMKQHDWLRDLFDFPPTVYTQLVELRASLDDASSVRVDDNGFDVDFESRGRALLHLKANFFASAEAWRVMARPEWGNVAKVFTQQRIEQIRRRSVSLTSVSEQPDLALLAGNAAVQRWYDDMPAASRERVIFYAVLGSANQNDRSMVSDGEDALVLSNWPPVIPYLDLLTLVGQCEWIEGPEELDALLPRQGKVRTRFAHWFRHVF